MNNDELLAILEQSRKSNYLHGITGMLLYVEGIFASVAERNIESGITGRFMQILEGSKEEVERLFDKIKQDSRHINIITLDNALCHDRNFESWQMGFTSLSRSDLDDNASFFDPDILFTPGSITEVKYPLNFLRSFYLRGQSQGTTFQH